MMAMGVIPACLPSIEIRMRSPVAQAAASAQGINAPNQIHTRIATNSAEYRAAAYLRAQSFWVLPADRSEYARRSHLRMKGDEMWNQIEVAVTNQKQGAIVIPIVAVTAAADLTGALEDTSVCIPTEDGSDWVVGTLDVNICSRLLSEQLIGHLPEDPTTALHERAYLSNVCVLTAARRQGVARALIDKAADVAIEKGVKHLYVHVVHDNIAAKKLYEGMKFSVEQEESEAFARGLNRPRRLLLHRSLQ